MFTTLIIISLTLALLPALITVRNLRLYRPLPALDPKFHPQMSLLIPARDEEAQIGGAVEAALKARAVDIEVIVLNDYSSDGTAAIVQQISKNDPRVRLENAPALPAGWCGKQYACQVLSAFARHSLLVFIDADVRLAPDALARIAAYMRRHDLGLASGFPLQQTGTIAEKLIIPLIHFLLLGFLPIWRMRRSLLPALGAGCGQLICVRRDAYQAAGGHAAIRMSLHDGVTLPRAFRSKGIMTDVFDATSIATCRMYRGAAALWRGFSKNATEGMATPVGLPIWSVLLFGGQVMPFILLPIGLLTAAPKGLIVCAAVAVGLVYANRIALKIRFRQSGLGAALHPVGIVILLVLQWTALVNWSRGRPRVWRKRAYSRASETE
jgi:hypothetical protein